MESSERPNYTIRRLASPVAGNGDRYGLYIFGHRRIAEGTKREMQERKRQEEAR